MDRQAMGTVRKSVNLVAVFTMEQDESGVGPHLTTLIADTRAVPGPEGMAMLRDCCAKADLVMMAVCDEGDGVLGAIRARAWNRVASRPPYDLTPHELRLLGLLVEGHSYKTAATELGVSVNTVAFHIQNIYGKMNVHSKAEAVARALNEGILLRRAS